MKDKLKYNSYAGIFRLSCGLKVFSLTTSEEIEAEANFMGHDVGLDTQEMLMSNPVYQKHCPSHFETLEIWRKQNSERIEENYDYENNCMNVTYHLKPFTSVDDYHHLDVCYDNLDIKRYSFRRTNGEPFLTMEVINNTIHKCRGKNNSIPRIKHMPLIQEFIENKKLSVAYDPANLGFIQADNEKLHSVFDILKTKLIKKYIDTSYQR